MDEIVFSDTAAAKSAAEPMMKENYLTLIEELRSAKHEISVNWEGDTTDINDIVLRIDQVIADFEEKVEPSVTRLAQGVYYLADAVEKVSAADVETGTEAAVEAIAEGTQQVTDASATESSGKPGFWEYHGQKFADDWDYSGCDGALDYVGATVDGIVGTAGSVVNFAVDGVGELLDWIF